MSEVETGAAAPEVTPAVAQTVIAPDSTAETAAETQPEAKPERTFTQSEVDEIAAKRDAKRIRQAERVAYEKAKAEFLQQELDRMRSPAQSAPVSGKPEPTQYKTYEEFVEALTDWKTDQKLSAVTQKFESERESYQQQAQSRQLQEHLASAATKYADFHDVVTDPDLPISLATAKYIAKSKAGGDVAYYLGTHPDEARRIASLDPLDQVIELVGLEAKVTAPPKVTKAPAPIEPTAGKTATEKDLSDLNYDEFVARRKKQIAARRG